ncbi:MULTISPECIES: Na+/H+ antiporter subunit E [unclassified Bradyrhizobium]|uniref:Na+/H+ antiporter subunit E n=1 Tax=unclassified Bradyrhizobium TaxID=2631580 RepID=UPI001FD8F6C2|nr:Na+/H+ antiporter subunit E [Bradyrhizobium sp. WSM1253]
MLLYRYANSRIRTSKDTRLQTPTVVPPDTRQSIHDAGFSKHRTGRRHPSPIEESPVRGSAGKPDALTGATAGASWWSATSRAASFLCLWLVLSGAALDDVPAAAVAVAAATWTSLHWLEPGRSRRSPGAISRLTLLFLYHSIVAGVDVARRALDPPAAAALGVYRIFNPSSPRLSS